MVLCDQWCGTSVHFVNGVPHNDRDNKPHVCSQAQRAREFEGYYNMIQIQTIRTELDEIEKAVSGLTYAFMSLKNRLARQEQQNKPLAEAFMKRKQKGRERNKQVIQKPAIKVASEMLTQ